VYIVLDTRIGCLRGDLKPDSEPQKIIKDVQTIFDALHKTEILPSFWKYVSTPAVRNYVKAADTFTE
jgi:hypothetical protein